MEKITSFTQLEAWKKAHELVLIVYKQTETFPKKEIFCLSSQIKRSAVSITSNIAEGFSRQTAKEKQQFYSIAIGSLTELHSQLFIARDVDYISSQEFDINSQKIITISKLLYGLQRTAKTKHTEYHIPNTVYQT